MFVDTRPPSLALHSVVFGFIGSLPRRNRTVCRSGRLAVILNSLN